MTLCTLLPITSTIASDDVQSQYSDLQHIAAHDVFAKEVKQWAEDYKEPQVKAILSFLDIIDPKARDAAFRESKPKRGVLTEIALFMTKYFFAEETSNEYNTEVIDHTRADNFCA